MKGWRVLVGLWLMALGLLQTVCVGLGLDGLSWTGRRRRAGRRWGAGLLLGGALLLSLGSLLPAILVLTLPALLLAAMAQFGLTWWRNGYMTPPLAAQPGSDDPWTAEPVSFADATGPTPGLFLRTRQPNGATVCWVHGVGDDKSNYKWVILRALAERGIHVLTFDLPGHGDRLASPFTLDKGPGVVGAALNYLRSRPDVDPARLGLMGVSLGGMLSIRTLAGSDPNCPPVRAVALLQVPCSLCLTRKLWWREASSAVSLPALNMFRACSPSGLYRAWKPQGFFDPDLHTVINAIRPQDRVTDMPAVPTLFVYGGRDPIATLEHGQMLYSRTKPPKAFHIVRSASHVSLIFIRETAALVADWFETHL